MTTCAVEGFKYYIDKRQAARYYETTIDPYLKASVDKEEFTQSQAYNAEKASFSLKMTMFGIAKDYAIFTLFVPAWLWHTIDAQMYTHGICGETVL